MGRETGIAREGGGGIASSKASFYPMEQEHVQNSQDSSGGETNNAKISSGGGRLFPRVLEWIRVGYGVVWAKVILTCV